MLTGSDKAYHIAACAFIVIASFALIMVVARLCKSYVMSVRCIGGSCDITDGVDVSVAEEVTNDYEENHTEPQPERVRNPPGDFTCMDGGSCACSREVTIVLCVSAISSFAIGIVKEIGDAHDLWPRCNVLNEDGSIVGCQASWLDILADFIGVLIGLTIVIAFRWMWFHLCS